MAIGNGNLDPRVSAKGWMQLARIDQAKANHLRCVLHAGREFAVDSGLTAAWFCISVAGGREKSVEEAMLKAGIEALVPMRMGPERKRRYRIIPASPLPVMSGYVMVRCVFSGEAMHALHAFDHVAGVLGGWDKPHVVSDEKMIIFKDMASKGHFDYEKPVSLFRPGVKVEILAGPLVGFTGPILSGGMASRGDAVVELQIFGRATPILIPLAMLRPL